jgi:hypothetical protein
MSPHQEYFVDLSSCVYSPFAWSICLIYLARNWATSWAFDYSTSYSLYHGRATQKTCSSSRSSACEEKGCTQEPGEERRAQSRRTCSWEDTAADKKAEKKSSGPPKQGDKIDLESFGGEIENNDGEKVTLASLVQSSKKGVVLFTYPKASTP